MSPTACVVSPLGSLCSSCGYCKVKDSSHCRAGLVAHQLSPKAYIAMMNRGWRRSGTYCYVPNLKLSCCPQYTIRLDAVAFQPAKAHRKLLSRWNRYVLNDSTGINKPNSGDFDLVSSVHAAENGLSNGSAHSFTITLELSSFTDEKYALYTSYQTEIHHDSANSPEGFTRFLVRSPLRKQPIPYPAPPPSHLPLTYGSYHQLYRLDGKLFAMGVIDILPHCVSSVYFMYEKSWEKYSLGKLSALHEISLVREIRNAGISDMSFLYMGFYIHSCSKMRYKGEYSPSFLLDPETHEWFPFKTCIPKLNQSRYVSFSHPHHSIEEPMEDAVDDADIPEDSPILNNISAIGSIEDGVISVIPIKSSDAWSTSEETREPLLTCFNALGVDLSQEFIFNV